MKRIIGLLGLALFLSHLTVLGQTNDELGAQTQISPVAAKPPAIALPDISLVANFLASGQLRPITTLAGSPGLAGSGTFSLQEVELIIGGRLAPGVKADLVFAYHDEIVEIEEGYATWSGFFPGGSLLVGRERLDLGRLNKIHPHAWSTVSAPLVLENFLGELKGTGVKVGWLLSLPFYLNLDLGAWKKEELEAGAFGFRDWMGTAKLLSSFALGTKAELQVGASGGLGFGPESVSGKDELGLIEADFTFKAFPGAYGRFVFQNEFYALVRNSTALAAGAYTRLGFYNFIGWKPAKAWEVAARFDMSQGTVDDDEAWAKKIVATGTYSISEATTLRLEYALDPDALTQSLGLQFVFGLGPHTHPIK
jgi:hypothetical protein